MTSPPPRTRPFAAFFHFVLLAVIIAGIATIATIAVVCSLDARGILPPAELRSQAENLLFLQGGTDGGGSIFFATLALFGLFHLLSAALLSTLCFDYRRRSCPDAPGPFLRDTLRAAFLTALPYLLLSAYTLLHLLLHCCAASGRSGLASMAYTSSASDSFILAFATLPALCLLTALWTAILARRPWKLHWKLLASPLVVLLWFFLAADGQTPRAGQRLSAFSEPLPAVRSWRHAAMLAWYDLFSSRPAAAPQDAPLWFWTDGQTEFGTRLHDSPSARALPVRSDLPWTAGRPVFVVPLAPPAPGASIFDAMPYHSPSRHLGGYFLQNPDASVIPIRLGVLDPVHPFPEVGQIRWHDRDVHLPAGAGCWDLSLASDGFLIGLRRTIGPRGQAPEEWPRDPDAWTGLDDLLAAPPIPVQIWADGRAPADTLFTLLRRLDAAGFREVFLLCH